MNIRNKLNSEFKKHNSTSENLLFEKLQYYKQVAFQYAEIENSIAVLSDLKANNSYIYYGKFAKELGIKSTEFDSKVNSIWEDTILKLIHPDDLQEKYIQELRFFNHLNKIPNTKRFDYFLTSKIRMRNVLNNYISIQHRMFYIPSVNKNNVWLALCLYNPIIFEIPNKCYIVNSSNGQSIELKKKENSKILTNREREILSFIDKGMMSKNIAELLSISINTVSRYRQDILKKLQVKNSIEACRIAKDLKII